MTNKTQQSPYSAMCFSQRGKGPRLVLFHASARDVLNWAVVPELGPKSSGPQRAKKEARVMAIKNFLSAEARNTIPTAIVLAFDKGRAAFKQSPNSQVGKLVLRPVGGRAAEIVDGQHRLYGMEAFKPTTEVAIVGLLDADDVEKAFQFLVINNKASRVPATHTKALLAKMSGTGLVQRLRSARLAFDAADIKDVDLLNTDPESPFFETIDWPTTPTDKRAVQATAIELSLDYLAGLGISEYDDRDTRRSVFIAMWKTIRGRWTKLWVSGSRLMSKVGIICLTRFIADRITSWADNEDLHIQVSDLAQIEEQTKKILRHMDARFWTTPWAEKAQGGFDTNQGRERVVDAIRQLYRNGRNGDEWYTDIDIVDRSAALQ